MASFEIVTEPIDRWPDRDTPNRDGIAFKATYDQTLRLLRHELEQLDTRGAVVIQVVTRNGAADVRRDGALMARAKIEHPGVRLSFDCKHGPLTYATDQFAGRWSGDMPAWQANLRAIALGLEALRRVDRYGITKRAEQYRGFRAIGAGTGLAPTGMTTERAIEILRNEAPALKQDEPLDRLVRLAKAGAHPDRHDGDRSRWNAVDEAEQVLRRAGRLS